jgi:hypothetical protein
MKNKHELFIRTLKKIDFTVFCVDTDQKKYYDKQFGVMLPYSSGQQGKRSIMDNALEQLNLCHAPITYNFKATKKDGKSTLEQKEITQPCDPTYFDQLLGGWMSAISKKDDKRGEKSEKTENEDEVAVDTDKNVYKRRSPLSISALTPLHPLLATLTKEKTMTFDRSESNDEVINVRDGKGSSMDEEAIKNFLETCNSKLTKRKLVSGKEGKERANGLFKQDIVIDLRKLFRVPIVLNDMEISEETIEKMKDEGWSEINDAFGKALLLPKKYHEEYAEAIAWAIVTWRITSNQSRTFDTMPTLSIAVSNNAYEIPSAIRAEIEEVDGKTEGKLVIDTNYPNTKIYSTNLLKGYLKDAQTSYTAIEDAANYIKKVILDYYSA